jgi:adenine-specific DNA methylase
MSEIRLRNVFRRMPLDLGTFSQDRLNIDGKERSNLFPWSGQFSPQLIEAVLNAYAPPGGTILDPFLGSGTVLCEAGRQGLPCYGFEINPAAYKMSRTYQFINVAPDERERCIKRLETRLHDATPDPLPIFSGSHPRMDSSRLQQALSDLKQRLDEENDAILLDTLIVLLDFCNGELTTEKVFDQWDKLKKIVKGLPYSQSPIELSNSDARALPPPDGCVDLVVTSPPYINVFNYHQQ